MPLEGEGSQYENEDGAGAEDDEFSLTIANSELKNDFTKGVTQRLLSPQKPP